MAGSEPAVLPLDEHGMVEGGAPREIQTPGLPGRSRLLFSLSYGCRWAIVAEEGVEPSAWSLWATRSAPLSYPAREDLDLRRQLLYLQNGEYKGFVLSASLRAP